MTAPLDGPSLPPASGDLPRQIIILLHGYGADGHDLIGLAPTLARRLPEAIFYSPNAPEPCEVWGGGRQWFSLARFDPDLARRDPATMDRAFEDLEAGASSALPALNSYLDRLLEGHGLEPNRLALLGFSQGTMMALLAGLRRETPLAAIAGFSGALLGASRLAKTIRSRPPVHLIHGQNDPIVPPSASRRALAALRTEGVDVDLTECPDLPHAIDNQGLNAAKALFFRAFSQDTR
ncbi:MAG: prolyl oligopeptidase family serine peptidase [Rhodospirillum sp.]|nr:prolyl oligopeptidase family serine peptidase [Rhodospirillum sp.]MCF8489361.1 prolyl oligopeptidase family serine peptidase [Rhodospirillum sp.]MCF8500717.1 prolyl oligopeptidase family serine peptidase [Rhodospirillum sp.]